jgi:TusA-related sulfurtransferase
MSNIVDTRGLLCPQPVMETLEEMGRIKKGQD